MCIRDRCKRIPSKGKDGVIVIDVMALQAFFCLEAAKGCGTGHAIAQPLSLIPILKAVKEQEPETYTETYD